MPTRIPKHCDPYLLIGLAVIVQAIHDLNHKDRTTAEQAKWWLEKDGIIWWEMLGYRRELLSQWLTGSNRFIR